MAISQQRQWSCARREPSASTCPTTPPSAGVMTATPTIRSPALGPAGRGRRCRRGRAPRRTCRRTLAASKSDVAAVDRSPQNLGRRYRMVRRLSAAAFALLLSAQSSPAQQPAAPVPLYPGAAPRPFELEPLPPIAPAPDLAAPPGAEPSPASPSAPAERVFCEQPVAVRLAEPDAVAPRYRPFVGIW